MERPPAHAGGSNPMANAFVLKQLSRAGLVIACGNSAAMQSPNWFPDGGTGAVLQVAHVAYVFNGSSIKSHFDW